MAELSPGWLSLIPDRIKQQALQSELPFDRPLTHPGGSACLWLQWNPPAGAPEAVLERLNTHLNATLFPNITRYGGQIDLVTDSSVAAVFVAGLPAAIACALAIAGPLVTEPSVGLRAGIGMGEAAIWLSGRDEQRWSWIVVGEGWDAAWQAAQQAAAGQVVITQALSEVVAGLVSQPVSPGFHRVESLRETPLVDAYAPPSVAGEPLVRLEAFVNPILRQQLQREGALLDEYRNVVIVHAEIKAQDRNLSASSEVLVNLLPEAIAYGGTLLSAVMVGGVLHIEIVFGAPQTHENDLNRAIRFVTEIKRLFSNGHFGVGISAGRAYCAVIGARAHQSRYAVVGGPVDEARRLAGSIQDGVLVAPGLQPRLIDRFPLEPYPTAQNLIGLRLGEARSNRSEPRYRSRMIGREDELEQSRRLLNQAKTGQGHVLGLVGEAGIGKSRLVAEIMRSASLEGFSIHTGTCQAHQRQTPYLIWQSILRGLLDLGLDASGEEAQSQIADALKRIETTLEQRVPLLAPVLNLTLAESDLTATLDAEQRRESLHALILTCLQAWSAQAPLLLVLEDCHWIDDLSADLLHYIGRSLNSLPIVLLVVYREEINRESPLGELETALNYALLSLRPFSPAETQRLTTTRLNQLFGTAAELEAAFFTRVYERTQGNPFYIEELLNYLHDRQIDLPSTQALRDLQLPATLRDLITSRIDLLSGEERHILKIASVIGRLFRATWLWGVSSETGLRTTAEQIRKELDHLNDVELTLLHQPEPELEYLFKHVLTQEVTYESLSLESCRVIHEQIAQFIESSFPANLNPWIDVLAYHYGRSTNTDKQRVYLRRAADQAKLAYASRSAVAYYEQLMPLLAVDEQAEVLLALGESQIVLGDLTTAQSLFERGLTLATADPILTARIQSALGYLHTLRAEYQVALDYLLPARMTLQQHQSNSLAQCLQYLTTVHLRRTEYPEALEVSETQLQLSIEAGDIRGIVEARMNQAWALVDQGRLDEALPSMLTAHAQARETRYQRGIIHTLSDIAGVEFELGMTESALARSLEAIETAFEIGFMHAGASILNNAGTVYLERGEFERALVCLGRGLKHLLEVGDRSNLVAVLGNIARVYWWQRQVPQAKHVLSIALNLCRRIDSPYLLVELLYTQSQFAAYADHDWSIAHQLNHEAAVLAKQIEDPNYILLTASAALRIGVELGQIERQAAIEQIMALITDDLRPLQVAHCHYLCWQIAPEELAIREQTQMGLRSAYEQSGNYEVRMRYAEVTGDHLPAFPPLLALPPIIAQEKIDLEALLARAASL
ncbi:MAG: AAA family ATPase [Anaerolineae bacterium]|nr:AAA family ATPase [Anaerolineae bacterium]